MVLSGRTRKPRPTIAPTAAPKGVRMRTPAPPLAAPAAAPIPAPIAIPAPTCAPSLWARRTSRTLWRPKVVSERPIGKKRNLGSLQTNSSGLAYLNLHRTRCRALLLWGAISEPIGNEKANRLAGRARQDTTGAAKRTGLKDPPVQERTTCGNDGGHLGIEAREADSPGGRRVTAGYHYATSVSLDQ